MSGGGGNSGGGGGGSSGMVDYPTYMKTIHEDWLHQAGDTIESSVTDIMNAALGDSPFTGLSAYDPTTPLADAWTAVCAFNAVVDALDHSSDWQAAIVNAVAIIDGNVITDTYINLDVDAFADVLDNQITAEVLPRFEAGMRDINAVMTSAFVIGRALIEDGRDKEVAKYETDLRLKLNLMRIDFVGKSTDRILTSLMQRAAFEKDVATVSIEAKRIHIVAKKEQADMDMKLDESDASWDLSVFQHGANVLAAIGGGTGGTAGAAGGKLSTSQSVLGGALAGASMGTAISPGWGTAIGAVVGGIGGLLM